MTFLDCLKSPKFDFTKNLSGSKVIKFQKSQALTSHFESFWSIVHTAHSAILAILALLVNFGIFQMDKVGNTDIKLLY